MTNPVCGEDWTCDNCEAIIPVKEEIMKHSHAEAFCLMTYKCEKCGKTEEVWNSRDGVTPFTIGCEFCDGLASHVNWHDDISIRDYIPSEGKRIFIDFPESLKRTLALRLIQAFENTPYRVPDEEREDTIKSLMESFNEGEPFLITWK